MGKKRKSVATSLDEVDRTMYSTFCSAANLLSQLYTHSMNQQKLSFQAGERHSLEKLCQWIWRQQEGGSRVTSVDILAHIQDELDCEEPAMSPRVPSFNQQHSQPTIHFTTANFPPPLDGPVSAGNVARPLHQSIQQYHLAPGGGGGGYCPNGGGNGTTQNNERSFSRPQNRDSSSNDSCMDMHAD